MKREAWYDLIIWGTMLILTVVLIYSITALDYWYHSTKGGIENTLLTFFPYVLAMLVLGILLFLRRKEIFIFPVSILVTISVVLLMHDIGIYLGLYDTFIEWWDKVAHYAAAVIVAYIGFFSLMYVQHYSRTITFTPAFIVLFIISYSCAFGLGWEVYELISDEILGSTMQYMSYIDTIQDMFSDILGALTMSAAGLWWLKHHSVEEFVNKFTADSLVDWINRKLGRPVKRPAVETDPSEFSD